MEISYWTMTDDQITQILNSAKELTIKKLQADGLVPADSDWAAHHVVMIHKRGWFGRAVDKLLFKDDDKAPRLTMLKVL